MRNKLLILFLLLSLISKSQTRWFKHLPGWLAINSLTFSDTILTSGMNNIVKSFGNKNGIFICWYNLVGDSIDQFNINLDSIYKDSLKSTEISYINNLSISNYFGYQLLISVRNGLLDNNSFLMTFDKFHTYNYKLEEIKVDTFVTFINNKIRVGKSNIYFLNFLDSKSNIYKTVIWNSSKISIKEYHDFKIEK